MFSRSVLATCSRRPLYSRSLTTAVASDAAELSSAKPPPAPKKPKTLVRTAIVLNRSPFLTPDLSPFDAAYQAYQGRIRRALHNPFPYDFYFKEGSILETRFTVEERKREREAFGPKFGLDDDLNPEKAEAARAAAAQLAEQEGENEVMVPRIHESDVSGDVKSLDRNGPRNVYLLVQASENGQDVWRFPEGGIEKQELLHQAAQRNLAAECDEHMDTWIVSKTPIGVYHPPSTPEQPQSTFLYKAHIMAGQVRPAAGVKDFAWLTKEEIQSKVDPHYWDGVKDVLSDV